MHRNEKTYELGRSGVRCFLPGCIFWAWIQNVWKFWTRKKKQETPIKVFIGFLIFFRRENFPCLLSTSSVEEWLINKRYLFWRKSVARYSHRKWTPSWALAQLKSVFFLVCPWCCFVAFRLLFGNSLLSVWSVCSEDLALYFRRWVLWNLELQTL